MYSFVSPYIDATTPEDYEAIEEKLSARDRERLDYYFEQDVFNDWFQTMDEWTKLRTQLDALREKAELEKAKLKPVKATRQDKLKQLRELRTPTSVKTILEDKEYSSAGDTGAASSQAGPIEDPPPPFQHALGTPRCRTHKSDVQENVNRLDSSRFFRVLDSRLS